METKEITRKKVKTDDEYFSPKMVERILQAEQEIKEGKGILLKSMDELHAYLEVL
ncbi:hypothetical protein Barb7_02284 [Bacteroidales bacterium Barb7]|nr:hypothetical protein Barb4_00709 [Bacteroidales bacterium Barb4]OAV74235.1 hypothetical protein Barb7_02284 [Bacteroidales bacterium Barb7]